ncbi:MAG TPA: glycosyltransferase [Gemmatimonadaceae bacterium]|nr:glycosyltransferase [Gemmatimonadaceae bacterium]
MRVVVHLTTPEWDGAARAALAAAHGLAERGHEVTIACAADCAAARRVDPALCDVAPVDAGGGHTPAATWALRRLIVERSVDVVVVQRDQAQLAAALAIRLSGRACGVVRRAQVESPAWSWRARAMARLVPVQVAIPWSSDVRAWEAAGARAPIVAPLGVDTTLLDPARPAPTGTVATVGVGRTIACFTSRNARSRAAHALRVVARLVEHHPELRLVLVGTGADDEDLRMHAAALRLTRVVSALDDHADATTVLAGAELGWVAAAGDDRAYAFLDLAALGVPALAEREPVAERLVADGITGLLVSAGDPAAGAATAARLLARADERAAMGRAARARIQRDFSIARYVDGMEAAVHAAHARVHAGRATPAAVAAP